MRTDHEVRVFTPGQIAGLSKKSLESLLDTGQVTLLTPNQLELVNQSLQVLGVDKRYWVEGSKYGFTDLHL